jgi:hypothetical protein
MINDEDGRRRANTIIYLMLSLATLNLVLTNHKLPQAKASRQPLVQESIARPEGAIATEKRLYNQYRPLVFGDPERGIKPLADLDGNGRVDKQEKALIYKLAGADEEQILHFGEETFYPVLTGYQMRDVWQKLGNQRQSQNLPKRR